MIFDLEHDGTPPDFPADVCIIGAGAVGIVFAAERHFQSHIDFNVARVSESDATQLHRWFANAYLREHKYHPKFQLTFPLQQHKKNSQYRGVDHLHQSSRS